jgi:hypothetical protein
MHQLVNRFLNSRRTKLNAQDIAARSFKDYYETCHYLGMLHSERTGRARFMYVGKA